MPEQGTYVSSWVFPTIPEASPLRHLEAVGWTQLLSPGRMGNHPPWLCQPVRLVKPGLHACFRCVLPSPGNPRPDLRTPWLGRALGVAPAGSQSWVPAAGPGVDTRCGSCREAESRAVAETVAGSPEPAARGNEMMR